MALMGLVREVPRIVRLVQEPGCGRRGRAPASENVQEVAMKAARGCVIGTRVSGACQEFLVSESKVCCDLGRGPAWGSEAGGGG